MKYEVKKLSDYDIAMIGSIYPLTELDMMGVMMDKGDIELPNINKPPIIVTIGEEFDDSFELPKGKPMKAADRRKRTYHKQQQREKKYRDLGYPIERFSASERGKMREGVGMFPESQHNYSMYNRNGCKGGMRGNRKEFKPITTKQAISMMEHERWLDEQEAIAEYEEAERLFMIEEMESLMQDVCWLDNQIGYERGYVADLMERVNNLMLSINSMENKRRDCLEKIEKMQEVLNK